MKTMTGRKRGLAILLVGLLVVTMAFAVYILEFGSKVDSSRLRWGVSEGVQYVYVVNVSGFNMTGTYNDSVECPLSFAPLNNTRIITTVSYLPDLPGLTDANSFATDVIVQTKNEVNFENGTELSERYDEALVSLISLTLLPIGDWSLIDSLYQDENPEPPFMKTWYIAKQHTSSFKIGYMSYGPDYASGWNGNLSLTTGLPNSANLHAWNAVESFSWTLKITLLLND
jgi:hypothetical protein